MRYKYYRESFLVQHDHFATVFPYQTRKSLNLNPGYFLDELYNVNAFKINMNILSYDV